MIKMISSLLLRGMLMLMGLIFLASLLVAALLLLAVWSVRALWARLMGRPVHSPLAFTLMRRAQWQRFYRSGAAPRAPTDDVIDVAARPVQPGGQDRFER